MKKYLATLHQRSESHRKNFALAVSGGFSLFILAIWLLVNYGGVPQSGNLSNQDTTPVLGRVEEVSPLKSLGLSLSASVGSVKEIWNHFKNETTGLNLEAGYDEMKQNALDSYVR